MIFSAWLAVGVFATIMTYTWLVLLPERRVTMTAGTSTVAWAIVAFQARNLEVVTNSGSKVAVDLFSVQLLAAFLAAMSAISLTLYQFGQYPPESTATGQEAIQQ